NGEDEQYSQVPGQSLMAPDRRKHQRRSHSDEHNRHMDQIEIRNREGEDAVHSRRGLYFMYASKDESSIRVNETIVPIIHGNTTRNVTNVTMILGTKASAVS